MGIAQSGKEWIVMRVVVFALTAPEHLNGVSRHAANLVRGLASLASSPEIHFVAGAWQREMFFESVEGLGSRIHCHWVARRNSNYNRLSWYFRDVPHIATQLEADLVHYVCPAPLRADAIRCPIVVSLHDLYPFEIPENFGYVKGIFNRLIMRQCLLHADAIACVSDFTRHTLKACLGQKLECKAVTICNAVESSPRLTHRVPQVLQGGQPFVLCVAQHRRNKNLLLALAIFERALQDATISSDTRLVIVGIPGPMTHQIQERIRKMGIERQVQLLSGLTDEELKWCYQHGQLLLAPSETEGFGLPVAEASLVGCPVVCSDIPAFREIGGDLCHFVSLGNSDVSAWTAAMKDAIVQPRIPVSLERLALSTIAQQYAALYSSLLAAPKVPHKALLLRRPMQKKENPARVSLNLFE